MKKPLLNAVLGAALVVTGAVALPSFAQQAGPSPDGKALRAATYDGVWSGTIKCLYDPGMWPDDECDIGLTFEISGGDLRVKQVVRSKKGETTTSDVNPGKFRFAKLGPSAIAISMDAGEDDDGLWVETWSFAMTLKDTDHMIVHWTRVVNNVDMPPAKKGSKFSSVGMGELVRKGPGT